jgi:NAD(P)-dependent dehydrogenase (short-subunit alcohol dehydrogenase family)
MTKTVLITGTSSGIGLAARKRFAAEGWNVIATMRDPSGHGPSDSANTLVTRLDVQDRASIARAVDAGLLRFGRIDALVNNAGYGQNALFEATPRDKMIEQFDVNVFGVMDVMREVLPHFRKQKGGVIVNVSSGAGLFTLPMFSLYCASKFALEGFTEAVSYELASQNITAKLVIPHGGVTSTNFGVRSMQGYARNPAVADYDAFVERTNAAFAKMVAARATSSDDVAKVIFEAATDGTARLRYLIGDDARGFVKARREMADQDYVDFMRSRFLQPA